MYPEKLIKSTISKFIESEDQEKVRDVQLNTPVPIIIRSKSNDQPMLYNHADD